MGRGYTIDRIANLDPHWWGHTDAGRFALMAAEDGLLCGRDIERLWGEIDLGVVRQAIYGRADRLATARGRGEARGLRLIDKHYLTDTAPPQPCQALLIKSCENSLPRHRADRAAISEYLMDAKPDRLSALRAIVEELCRYESELPAALFIRLPSPDGE